MPARKSASASAPAKAPKTPPRSETPDPGSTPPTGRKTGRHVKSGPRTPAAKAGAVTTINTRVDVGFGNQLYIRGDGPGLSWQRGVPAVNSGPDLWRLEVRGAKKPFAFKCLVNDQVWSNGDDFIASPGSSIVVAPTFH